MAAVSSGTSHARAVSAPLQWIFNVRKKTPSHSCKIACKWNESAQEQRIAHIKMINNKLCMAHENFHTLPCTFTAWVQCLQVGSPAKTTMFTPVEYNLSPTLKVQLYIVVQGIQS